MSVIWGTGDRAAMKHVHMAFLDSTAQVLVNVMVVLVTHCMELVCSHPARKGQ